MVVVVDVVGAPIVVTGAKVVAGVALVTFAADVSGAGVGAAEVGTTTVDGEFPAVVLGALEKDVFPVATV
jgi:hypothetical protein